MKKADNEISLKSALSALIVSGIGIGTSIYLTKVHYDAQSGVDQASCDLSDTINCTAAALSEYSVQFGYPVATLGAATYGLLFLIWMILAIRPGKFAISIFSTASFLVSGWCVIFSAFMAYILAAQLKVLCPACMLLYGVALFIFGISITEGRTVMILKNLKEKLLKLSGGVFASLGMLIMLTGATYWGIAAAKSEVKTEKQTNKVQVTNADNIPMEVDLFNSPAKGPAGAPVTVIEFSDFMCPYCKIASHIIKAGLAKRPDDVRFVFVHFPLDKNCNAVMKKQLHDGACDAAMAADCAGEQGRFWEYHDMLFDLSRKWKKAALEPMAMEIGLNIKEFKSCMDSEFTINRLKLIVEQGNTIGIHRTPTIFVNGKHFKDKLTPDNLVKAIDEAKKSK